MSDTTQNPYADLIPPAPSAGSGTNPYADLIPNTLTRQPSQTPSALRPTIKVNGAVTQQGNYPAPRPVASPPTDIFGMMRQGIANAPAYAHPENTGVQEAGNPQGMVDAATELAKKMFVPAALQGTPLGEAASGIVGGIAGAVNPISALGFGAELLHDPLQAAIGIGSQPLKAVMPSTLTRYVNKQLPNGSVIAVPDTSHNLEQQFEALTNTGMAVLGGAEGVNHGISALRGADVPGLPPSRAIAEHPMPPAEVASVADLATNKARPTIKGVPVVGEEPVAPPTSEPAPATPVGELPNPHVAWAESNWRPYVEQELAAHRQALTDLGADSPTRPTENRAQIANVRLAMRPLEDALDTDTPPPQLIDDLARHHQIETKAFLDSVTPEQKAQAALALGLEPHELQAAIDYHAQQAAKGIESAGAPEPSGNAGAASPGEPARAAPSAESANATPRPQPEPIPGQPAEQPTAPSIQREPGASGAEPTANPGSGVTAETGDLAGASATQKRPVGVVPEQTEVVGPRDIPRPSEAQPAAPIEAPEGRRLTEGEPVTAPRKAVTDAERSARGLPPVEMQRYKLIGPEYDKARAEVEAGKVDPVALAQHVAEKPRQLEVQETAALAYQRAKWITEDRDILRRMDATSDPTELRILADRRKTIEDMLDVNDQALRRGGREQSAAFRARQMVVNDDFSPGMMKVQAKAAKGLPLTEVEAKTADTLGKRVTDLETKLADMQSKLDEKSAATVVSKARTRSFTKDSLANERQGILNDFAKLGSKASANPIDTIPDGMKLLGKLAVNLAREGVLTLDELLAKVRTHLSPLGIDVTKQHLVAALNEQGKKVEVSQAAKNVREIKRQASAVKKTQDIDEAVRAGTYTEPPKKQRTPPTPEMERLQEDLDRAKAAARQFIKSREKTPLAEGIKQTIRASFVSSLGIPRKVFQSFAFAKVADSLGAIPAAGWDTMLSKITGQRASTADISAVMHGLQDAKSRASLGRLWQILKGTEPASSHAGISQNFHGINMGDSKFQRAWSNSVNGVFNTHAALYSPLLDYGYAKSLAEQARLAEMNGKGNYADLLANPTKEMIERASAESKEGILQNENRAGSLLSNRKGLTSSLPGQALDIAATTVMPTPNIAMNAAGRFLEHTPLGFVKGLGEGGRAIVEARRGNMEESSNAQRESSKAMARATVGTFGAIALGYFLARNGSLTGFYNRNANGKTTNAEGGHGNYQIPGLSGGKQNLSVDDSPAGKAAALGALWAEMEKNHVKGGADTFWQHFGNLISLEPIAEQNPVFEVGHTLESAKDKPGKFLTDIGQNIVPAASASIAKASDYGTQRKTDTFLDALKARIPGLRQTLPVK